MIAVVGGVGVVGIVGVVGVVRVVGVAMIPSMYSSSCILLLHIMDNGDHWN